MSSTTYYQFTPLNVGRWIIWGAFALVATVLIAVDVRRDGAQQRREDREWAELVRMLEEGP